MTDGKRYFHLQDSAVQKSVIEEEFIQSRNSKLCLTVHWIKRIKGAVGKSKFEDLLMGKVKAYIQRV